MVRDLHRSLRHTAQRPGFALTVVFTLALGIGSNTAVFSLINAIVLRPLPYQEAGRLFELFEEDTSAVRRVVSYPTFEDWRKDAIAFEGMAFVRGTTLRYEVGDRSGLLLGAFVTADFFRVLRMRTALGRTLRQGDFEADAEPVGVLSHAAWRSWFGGDSAIVGRSVRTATGSFTVVGVMPGAFDFPNWGIATHVWMPMPTLPPPDRAALQQRDFHADSRVIARVRSGQSIDRARTELGATAIRLAVAYPSSQGGWTRVAAESLKELTIRNVRPRLLLFGGAVAAVLLICCLNLANLYLAQGAARRHEFAIRAALGAGRLRVVRQLFTECLVLAVAGGALGTVAAGAGIRMIVARESADLPRLAEVTVDVPVLLFAFGLTAGAAVLFAVVGAWPIGSRAPSTMLQGRQVDATSTRSGRLRGWLQAGQIGMTFVLLTGAALLMLSFVRMTGEDLGFRPKRLVAIPINPPSPRYDSGPDAVELYGRLIEAVAAVPGVRSAAVVNHAPPSFGGMPTPAAFGGIPTGTSGDIQVLPRTVSAGYFTTTGIPIVAGREFDDADIRGPPGPVIVSESLARRWGGGSPIGRTIGVRKASRTRHDFGEPLLGTVVGVAGDITPLRPGIEPAMVYVPYPHDPWPETRLLVRTEVPSVTMLSTIEDAVRAVDPAIPVEGPFLGATAMDQTMAEIAATRRVAATVVTVFALIGLLLAAIGMYGVIAYTVSLQTREIGVRMAIGATRSAVLRAIVGHVIRITLAGLVSGVMVALAATRLMRTVLYQVDPTEPTTYLAVALVLFAVGTLAGYLPARRAAQVHPMVALTEGGDRGRKGLWGI